MKYRAETSLDQFIASYVEPQKTQNQSLRKKITRTVGVNVEQAQQREIQHVVSMQIDQNIALNEYEDSQVKGLDFEDLKSAILNGQLNLRDGAQILSEDSLKKNWHRWLGDVLALQGGISPKDLLQSTTIPQFENPKAAFYFSYDNLKTKHNFKFEEGLLYFYSTSNYEWSLSYQLNGELITRVLEDKNYEIRNKIGSLYAKKDQTIVDEKEFYQLIQHAYFKKSEGLLFSSANPQMPKISLEAAEQLLSNPLLFQQGLNPLLFDNGFVLVRPSPDEPAIVHYRPEAQKRKILYSPKLKEEVLKVALNLELCEELLKKLPQILQNAWKKIKTEEDSELFRRNILRLAKFSEEQLKQLFDGYNLQQIDYILTIYPLVATADSSDGFLINSLNTALNQKTIYGKTKEVIELCKTLSVPQNANLDLSGFMEGLDAESTQEKLALLELYSVYGEKGPQAYSLLKKHESFALVNGILFKNLDSFLPLLDNIDKLKLALDVIASFDDNQREWFLCFLTKHATTVGYDDLADLIESFSHFSNRIKEYKLNFYKLPENAFTSVKNLPTALGNILSIIRENKPSDREIQWNCISQICLDGNAAIRALSDSEKCTFIIPEMRIEPKYYDFEGGYNRIKDPKDLIKGESLDEIRANFYQFIAHQAHRLPLSFYQEMEPEIIRIFSQENQQSELILKCIGMLYSLLASSTTGEQNCLAQEIDESKIKELKILWKNIVKKVEDCEFPYIVQALEREQGLEALIKSMYSLSPPGNLFIIYPILNMYSEGMKSFASIAEARLSRKLPDINGVRNEFANKYGIAIFKSMDHYRDSEISLDFSLNFYQKAIWLVVGSNAGSNSNHDFYKNFNIYSKFLNESKTQGKREEKGGSVTISYPNGYETEHDYPPTKYKEAFAALLALMSHFKIDQEEAAKIDALRQRFVELCSQNLNLRLAEGLTLLQSMRSVNPQWTAETLKGFIETIAAQPQTKLSKLVKDYFGEQYFDKDFFELCDAKILPAKTMAQINKYFEAEQRPEIVKMLKIFGQSTAMTETDYQLILTTLAKLLRNLPPKEADLLFKHLTNTNLHGENFHDFSKLLDLIPQQANLRYFFYFAEKSLESKSKDLTGKSSLFLLNASEFVNQYQPILSEKIVLNLLSEKILSTEENPVKIGEFFNRLIALIKKYPQAKESITEYMPEFISKYKAQSTSMLARLSQDFLALNNPDLALSLFSNLLEAEEALDLGFLEEKSYLELKDKALFWKIISQLLNNNFPIKKEELTELLIKLENSEAENIAVIYESAPYPDLNKLNELINSNNFKDDLQQFKLNPYPIAEENGFDLRKAKDFAKKIKGINFTDEQLIRLDEEVRAANLQTADQLQEELKKLDPTNLPKLAAITTRLLYLSTAKSCNTIQYLALFAELNAGSRLVSQLETGEGKSRINMLMAACQYIRDTTTEFITKDMHLAERDYLGYKAFFETIGAETSLVYSDSPINVYKKKAIHFTTISDLAHFIGRAHAEGQLPLDDPKKRTLIVDESDYIFFELYNNQFNLSMNNPTMAKLAFVYEDMVEFFYSYPQAKNWDADYTDQKFLNFIRTKNTNKLILLEQNSTPKQRKIWQESALIALDMKLKNKFIIQSNVQKETAEGIKIVSEAKVLMNNRPEKGEFTDGVHQFLHARLNWLKHLGSKEGLEPHDQEIVDYFTEHPASQLTVVEAEKSIYYSLSVRGVIDNYRDGSLYCITATPGTETLGNEVDRFYGVEKNLSFPPAQPSQRITHPTYLAANDIAQWERFVVEIEQAQKNNQPYLLICENDTESEKLYKFLANQRIPNLFRLSAETNKKTEKRYIANEAGKPGQVTITTAMHGRGTDIRLVGEAHNKGLKVAVSYLPKSLEDQIQIFGRAARFGSFGEAGFILNKEKEKARLNKETLNDGFYFSAEQYLANQQAVREQETQIQRIIQIKVTDFQQIFQTEFYNKLVGIYKPEAWIQFHREVVREWKELSTELSGRVDASLVREKFETYKTKVEKIWKAHFQHPLPESLALNLGEEFDSFFASPSPEKLKVPLAESYHPAHDGRAVLYSRPFEKWRALFRGERPIFADFRAWLDGRGILFPQLRAWWSGAMTTNQFMFGVEELSESDLKILRTVLMASLLLLGVLIGGAIGGLLVYSGVFAPFGAGLFGFLILMGIGSVLGFGAFGLPMLIYNYFVEEPAYLIDGADFEQKPEEIPVQGSYDGPLKGLGESNVNTNKEDVKPQLFTEKSEGFVQKRSRNDEVDNEADDEADDFKIK